MRTRAHVIVGAVAATALVLTACGSGGDDDASTSAPTVTVTETVTTSPSASSSTSASASPSASATSSAGNECATGKVTAVVREEQSGAGQRYATVVLTNTSKKSCTVTGYPGLQLVGASGQPVATKVIRKKKPAPATVKLAAGASASSAIAFSVVASGAEPTDGPCRPEPTSVQVIPPNQTTAVTAPWSLGSVCDGGRIKANAFVAG
jgi:hypothetical protein